MIIPLVYKCLNRLRFSKVNSIQYWNIMIVINNNNILKVNIYSQIILIFTFISTSLFAHPHSTNDLESQQHTHTQNENDLIYELDDFNDLNFQSSNSSSDTYSKKNPANKQMILFDDNLYLLDDEFDFGDDEFELQKMEINTDDLEIAKEYEDFLNSFFIEATLIGNKPSNSKSYTNPNLKIRQLYDKINNLKSEKEILNQKIENLEKQLQSGSSNKSYDNIITEFSTSEELSEPSKKNGNPPSRSGFGIYALVGATIPLFQKDYGIGSNVGIRLETPLSFTLSGMEAKVGTEIYFSSMNSTDNYDYNLTNIVGNISIAPAFNSSIEIGSGLGLTFASIWGDKKLTLSIPIYLSYYLPVDLSGYKIGLNLLTQLTMGHPTLDQTTSLLNASLVIKTPIRF